jgi:hypothetical protein
MRFRSRLRLVVLFAIVAATVSASAAAQEFEILHARYGSARRNIDVTRRLRQLAGANATFRLSWRTFGDPAEGQAKTLRIFARGPRGANRFFEYRDNDIVDGSMFSGWGNGNWGNRPWRGGWNPGPGWNAGDSGMRPPGYRPPNGDRPQDGNYGLRILSARYGAGRAQVDVTGRLQSLVNNGRLNIPVSNGAMAVADPAPNVPKALTVTYSMGNGPSQTRTAREGSNISLP